MYHDAVYWNMQHDEDAGQADINWFFSYKLLKEVLQPVVKRPRCAALVVGSGTSTFPEELYDEGVREVMVVDVSSTAVQAVRSRNESLRSGLSCQVLDIGATDAVAKLVPAGQSPYDLIVEKGTLDCILCDREGYTRATNAVRALYESLKTPGTLILVSHSPPTDRLELLQTVYWHDIQVKVVKPIPLEALCQEKVPDQVLEDMPELPATAQQFEAGAAYVYLLTK